MLELKDIVKIYPSGGENVRALKGVSLQFRNCEFVSILGPSGCGKSTMLNIIGGLDHYTEGDLLINGRSTTKYKDRDWDTYRNHSIGFVFQSYNLIPHQTVLSNVELALTLSGVGKKERRERAKAALEAVGLGNQLRKRPAQMSGGQMQRVAIARAIVNDPDIILADEPTGALDSETSVQVMKILKEISRDRLVVMVTHNPELAEEYSTRIIRMLDGSVQSDSMPISPEELEQLRLEDETRTAGGGRPLPEEAVPEEGAAAQTAVRKPRKRKKRASMSFMTAFGLSLNNLFTKKGRTLLTSFAGSIGIIGIALIYAVSQGTSDYIDRVQEDTISAYPLSISSESADFTSIISGFLSSDKAADEARNENSVTEQQFIASLFSGIGSNDLRAFKKHLETHAEELSGTVNAVSYSYGLTPEIYTRDLNGKLLQANPGTFSAYMSMASSYGMSAFSELSGSSERTTEQYELLTGRWPEQDDELIMILQDPGQISDFLAYSVGLHDLADLQKMMEKIMRGETPELTGETNQWTYDELMALEFRLVNAGDRYRYDAEHKVWEDMTDSESWMERVYEDAIPLKTVGIAVPSEDASSAMLTPGFYYRPELILRVMENAANSEIVKSQLRNEDIDVFSGKPFGEKSSESGIDFRDMISVDEEALTKAFDVDIDTNAFSSALSGYLNGLVASLEQQSDDAASDFGDTFGRLATGMLQGLISEGGGTVSLESADSLAESYLNGDDGQKILKEFASRYGAEEESLHGVFRALLAAMTDAYVLEQHPEITEPIIDAAEEIRENISKAEETSGGEESEPETPLPELPTELPTQEEIEAGLEALKDELPTQEEIEAGLEALKDELPTQEEVEAALEDLGDAPVVTPEELLKIDAALTEDAIPGIVSAYSAEPLMLSTSKAMGVRLLAPSMLDQLKYSATAYAMQMIGDLMSGFSVDEEAIANAFQFNMTEEDLTRLITTLSGKQSANNAESNLNALGYADPDEPTLISVYLKDFDAKERFKDFIGEYNDAAEAADEEEKVIHYTDITGVLMSSVTTIVNAVTYVLIAFVAISLVVSSIMIGVITLISVQERTKEIGILRAIGASKRNVSSMFNAETVIIGFSSGAIGVLVTYLLCIPINLILHRLTGISYLSAKLPVSVALILVLISMLLTLVAGIIPSRSAAKKDPVVALRTE